MRGARKQILQKKPISPSGVTDDQIWHKALLLQLFCDSPNLLPLKHTFFKTEQVAMGLRVGTPPHAILNLFDTLDLNLIGLSDEDHLVITLRNQSLNQVLELARHVGM